MKEVKNDNVETVDVAIIGGGPGGCYLAWCLQQYFPQGDGSEILPEKTGQSLSIKLYEGSNRIGGRVESLNPPGAPHLVAEFGGMGYSTNHVRVASFVDYLGLPTKELILGTPQTINYLRGEYFRDSQVNNASLVPYQLNAWESGKSYGQILVEAVNRFLPGNDTWSTAKWRDQMYNQVTLNGMPLYEVSLWNVMLTLISNEAYRYAEDAMGHMPFIGAWNAAEALPWNFISDRTSTKNYALVGGYDQLATVPFEKFVQAGGQYAMNKRLTTFEKNSDGTITLTFDDNTQTIATSVVLAMPRRSLELISENTPLEDPAVMTKIQSVTPVPHLKIFMAYDTPWWTQAGVVKGHSITDMPLRTCYYEGTESQRGGNPNNYNSLLMASYTDGRYLSYWEGLNQGDIYKDRPNPWVKTPPDPDYWHEQPVTENIVNELQRQLKIIHQLHDIPMPYSAAWKDWRDDPFGGAWNSWNVGVNAMEMIPDMLQPVDGMNMYVCGSAYSHWQGWVEGAYETANLLLGGTYGIKHMDWQTDVE